MTSAPPDRTSTKPDRAALRQWLAIAAVIAAMTAVRVVYASVVNLDFHRAVEWVKRN